MTTPNIVFITTHDTGRYFHCYGQPTVRSPHIDRLAEEGVRLSNIFCTSPKCSPSRAAMMTGRYPQSNGVLHLTHAPFDWAYNPDEKHLAQVLAENGWETHLFHFQHEGEDPRALGFGHLHAMPKSHARDEMPDPWGHVTAPDVAEAFAAFCAEGPRKPFYAQIGFFETHNPLPFGGNEGDDELGIDIPANYAEDEANREFFRMLQGAVRQADRGVGIILEALKKHGLEENTIVVFTVDHGISYHRAKGTCYDLGLEVPFVIRWPGGGIEGGRVFDGLTSNIDVFPTLLELVGVCAPPNVEGRSFAPALRGEAGGASRDAVFGMIHQDAESRCIRTERWKLIRNFEGAREIAVPISGKALKTRARPFVELYDLASDPMETVNLAASENHRDTLRELDRRLRRHLEQVSDPVLRGPVVNPYYRDAARDFASCSA